MFFGKSNLREMFVGRAPRNFAFVAAVFVVCFLFNASSSPVHGATFVVNSTTDANDATAGNGVCETVAGNAVCTLRAAISEANALAGDDIITLPAGTYTTTLPTQVENVNAGGDFDITSNITINGAGADSTFIQAAAAAGTATERALHFVTAGTSTVNNVTIRFGRYTTNTFGGGARADSGTTATFNNVIFRDNTSAGRGGGFYVNGGTATLNNCTITANTSGVVTGSTSIGGAGFYINTGTATLNNTTTNNNQSINNSTVAAPNTPSAFGGGVTIAAGTLNLNNSSVNNNISTTSVAASAFGAGIAMSGATTIVNLTNTSISNNTTSSTGTGGASVGGIDNEGGTLTLNTSTVSGNTAPSSGGIRTLAGTVAATTTLNQSAIVNNTGTTGAGGVSNAATGAAAAITNINNSTIGGNTTNGSSGGIQNSASSTGNATTNINFSTVAGNSADADNTGGGNGGGINNNFATTSTGLFTVNLSSSVIANNTVGTSGASPDVRGAISSQGYNHVEDVTGSTFSPGTGDVTGTDPALGALDLNGGQTLNYLPNAGSPLIDTIPMGTNQCGTAPFNFDQKNVVRPFDTNFDGTSACEKGASERGLVIITPSNLPNGQVGQPYSLTLTANFGNDPYTFALASGTLPPGLTLNSNGTITGTPTAAGVYNFIAQVEDTDITFRVNGIEARAPAVPNVSRKNFQITIAPAVPTAAGVSISGRVSTPQGSGLTNALVTLTDSQGNSQTVLTRKAGSFKFTEVAAGETYVLSVVSKRYRYTPQIVTANEDLADLNFNAQP